MSGFIDRDLFEKDLREAADRKAKYTGIEYANGMLDACSRLMQFPDADVKPVVRGYWIRKDDSSCIAKCSNCTNDNNYAFVHYVLDGEDVFSQQDLYCPFCGADMRGKHE